MKKVLSCIQPTGDMHFGNYFGAVKNWVDLQQHYECVYGVVDYHAMTMPYNTKKLRENTWALIFNLLAVGVEADNLFIQSLVPEHTELGWIFNNFASFGRVENMTQFKDKSKQSGKGSEGFISVGLYDYPVLQAADILMYRADLVPVGADQSQHLELTREIANRFNNRVGKEYFVLPKSLHTETPKIFSTADPTLKMSKSAGEKHYISVFADEGRIRKQIKSAVTGSGIYFKSVFISKKMLKSLIGHPTIYESVLNFRDLLNIRNQLIKPTSKLTENRKEKVELLTDILNENIGIKTSNRSKSSYLSYLETHLQKRFTQLRHLLSVVENFNSEFIETILLDKEYISPGEKNLFQLLKACNKNEIHDDLMKEYRAGKLKSVDLKETVADALVELNVQFRANREELLANKKEVKNKIKASSAEIRKRAQETLREVKDLTGLINVRF